MKKDKEKDESDTKDIEVVMKNLRGFIRQASEKDDTKFLTTGHFALDLAIAHGVSPDNSDFDISNLKTDEIGGLPIGKLIEFSGPESCGKSSLAYRVCGYAQQKGMKCLWIDAEQSFSRDLAEINGIDVAKLGYADLMDLVNPDHIFSAEEVFDMIMDSCKSGFNLIVLDSVANLTTQAELDNRLADGGVGMAHLAQVLSKAIKKVVQYAAKYNVLIIFINQQREKIGISFGDPTSTPGGRALKHLSSVRIKLQKQSGKDGQIRIEDEDGKDNLIGGLSYAYILKNRFGKPVDGSIKIPIYYEHYFPDAEDVIFDTGRALKIIKPRLGVFSWGDTLKATGKISFIDELKKQKLVDKLVAEITTTAKEEKFILPPEVVHYESEPITTEEETNGNGEEKNKVSRRRKTKNPDGEPVNAVES